MSSCHDKISIPDNKGDIDKNSDRIDQLEQRVSALEDNVSLLSRDLDLLSDEFDVLDADLADLASALKEEIKSSDKADASLLRQIKRANRLRRQLAARFERFKKYQEFYLLISCDQNLHKSQYQHNPIYKY